MKLYQFPVAPNPARVAFFVTEKRRVLGDSLELEEVMIDLTRGEQNSPEFLQLNPTGTLPVLVLDDGSTITESLVIMEYLEECYPQPPLIGTTTTERAQTRAMERFIEMNLLLRVIRIVHATRSPLGLPANPALAASELQRLPRALSRMDERIGNNEFVMGSAPSIADCTLLAAMNFARFGNLEISSDHTNLTRWFDHYALRHR